MHIVTTIDMGHFAPSFRQVAISANNDALNLTSYGCLYESLIANFRVHLRSWHFLFKPASTITQPYQQTHQLLWRAQLRHMIGVDMVDGFHRCQAYHLIL